MSETAVADLSIAHALDLIFRGLALLGDGVILLIQACLGYFGIVVPDIAIRIATMIIIVLAVWKLSTMMNRLVVWAVVFLLISLFAGLIPAVGDAMSGLLGGGSPLPLPPTNNTAGV